MKKLYFLFIAFLITGMSYSQSCIKKICNGNFDSTVLVTTVSLFDSTSVYCWHTTASDKKMEIWANGYNSIPSYSGIQFCELNATMPATMYQIVNLTAGSNLKIQFAHRGRGGMDSVKVSCGPQGGPYTTLGVKGDGSTQWGFYTMNYPVSASGNYAVRFTPVYWGFGNIGVGNLLDAVTVCEQLGAAGITEYENSSLLSVYPNPASSEVKIKFENSSKDVYTLSIIDAQGKLVKTATTDGDIAIIERKDLDQGIYFFRLTSVRRSLSGKFVFAD